jgi:phage-related protein
MDRPGLCRTDGPARRGSPDCGLCPAYGQGGAKHDKVKPLKGYKGAGVLEVVEDHDGDTYRAVYTVRFAGTVYVLHCFQKKAKKGISTPKSTIDLINKRLQQAAAIHQEKEKQR